MIDYKRSVSKAETNGTDLLTRDVVGSRIGIIYMLSSTHQRFVTTEVAESLSK